VLNLRLIGRAHEDWEMSNLTEGYPYTCYGVTATVLHEQLESQLQPKCTTYVGRRQAVLINLPLFVPFLGQGPTTTTERGIPKCDTVRLMPTTLTLNSHHHIHTQARKIPILIIVARSHSHSVGHTHTQLVILTLGSSSYSHSGTWLVVRNAYKNKL
jgi:hypothetical protein